MQRYFLIRYQDCPWFVRFWRCRYYLAVPFLWLHWYFFHRSQDRMLQLPSKEYWAVLQGLAEYKMQYYYTKEEAAYLIGERLE
jgi:hypothetical protein